MLESAYQSKLIKKLKKEFPGCVVLKNDPTYIQGMPDLLVLKGQNWAALEVKRNTHAHHQPNQDYYVDKLNRMSYAAFISPENEKEVIDDLRRSLEA